MSGRGVIIWREVKLEKLDLGVTHAFLTPSWHSFSGQVLPKPLLDVEGSCKRFSFETDAIDLYERALSIHELVSGQDNSDVAAILHSIALIHDNQGRLSEAIPLYERALFVFDAISEQNSETVVDLLQKNGLQPSQSRTLF